MFLNSLSRATGNVAKNVRGIAQETVRITDREAIELLGKFCNLKYLSEIVDKGRGAIQPRTAQTPVSEAGLLAIAAYTSAGLDRMIHDTYSPTGGLHITEVRKNVKKTGDNFMSSSPSSAGTK